VAELVLDERTELTESLMIFQYEEERVVTESGLPTRLTGEASSARTLGFQPNCPGRVR
jgi:hypothetical protein